MYGLNAVALVFFGCINVLAYRLCQAPARQRRGMMTGRKQYQKFAPARA